MGIVMATRWNRALLCVLVPRRMARVKRCEASLDRVDLALDDLDRLGHELLRLVRPRGLDRVCAAMTVSAVWNDPASLQPRRGTHK